MLPLILAAWLSGSAHAITTPQSGPYLDLGAGLGLGNAPLGGGVGWNAGFGWWFGPYDDAYAIGRYWSVGATVRQDWIAGSLRSAPMLEVRRGVDLIVAGWHGFLAGGPLLATTDGATVLGGTARAGVGLEFRRTRFLGLTLRLEGGADLLGDRVGGAGAALLGFQFSRPGKDARKR